MAHDVFISYSTKDKATADAVVSRFESKGLRCWYAPRDIEPGADWAGSIIQAIVDSKVMALIFTPDSNISKQVLREVDSAVGAGVTVIPMRLTEEEPIEGMQYYLSAVHWLDAIDEDLDASIDEWYALCRAVVDTPSEALLPTQGPGSGKKGSANGKLVAIALAGALALGGGAFAVSRLAGGSGGVAPGGAATTAALPPIGAGSANEGKTVDGYVDGGTSMDCLVNGGYIAFADDWYYFRSNDHESLYKMRADGSEVKKLTDHSAMYISVYDGYVYFFEEHGEVGIYRVSTEGGEAEHITGFYIDEPFWIKDGHLYVYDSIDGLLRGNLDDEDLDMFSYPKTVCMLEDIFTLCTDGENLYYTTLSDDGVYRCNMDGSGAEKIVDATVSDVNVAGGYLYYNDLGFSPGFYAHNLATGETANLSSSTLLEHQNVTGDGIYAESGDGYLVLYDPQANTMTQLYNQPVAYVCVAGEKIFFWNNNNYLCCDLDGGNLIKL